MSYRGMLNAMVKIVIIAVVICICLYTINPTTAKAEDTTSNSTNIEQVHRTELPSTEGWEDLGIVYEDRTDEIPGEETILKGYEKGDIQLIFTFYKGQTPDLQTSDPHGFWFYDKEDETTYDTYVDPDNDGVFEVYVPKGKSDIDMDYEAWGVK